MVFQRDRAPCFAGFADEGQSVSVSIAGQTAVDVADSNGEFKVCLPAPLPLGGPYEAIIEADAEPKVLRNVMSGDVILCSGQVILCLRFTHPCSPSKQ